MHIGYTLIWWVVTTQRPFDSSKIAQVLHKTTTNWHAFNTWAEREQGSCSGTLFLCVCFRTVSDFPFQVSTSTTFQSHRCDGIPWLHQNMPDKCVVATVLLLFLEPKSLVAVLQCLSATTLAFVFWFVMHLNGKGRRIWRGLTPNTEGTKIPTVVGLHQKTHTTLSVYTACNWNHYKTAF